MSDTNEQPKIAELHPVLTAAQRAEMLRKQLADAEREESAEREAVERKEAARISDLRQTPTTEALHERVGYLETTGDSRKEDFARLERWLEILSAKVCGADHGLGDTFGSHHKAREADAKNPQAANQRDAEIAARKAGGRFTGVF